MRKRGHDTASDLFMNTMKMAREAGALDALDTIKEYELPNGDGFRARDTMKLTQHEFVPAFIVNIRGSGGIYIDAYIEGYFRAGQEMPECWNIGTIKTLREDLDAFKIMCEAVGVLTYYAFQYMNKHHDRYTPEGEEEGTT